MECSMLIPVVNDIRIAVDVIRWFVVFIFVALCVFAGFKFAER